jgi:hypothetical protein
VLQGLLKALLLVGQWPHFCPAPLAAITMAMVEMVVAILKALSLIILGAFL